MASFNFNKVILGGRLTADPELKTTQSGISVTSFTVAVNRRTSKNASEEAQADFFNVTAWRTTAEFITRYFHKASSICVVGSLQTRSWVDQQGVKRFVTEIIASEAFFVDAKADGDPIGAPHAGSAFPVDSRSADRYAEIGRGIQQSMAIPEIPPEEELPF